MSEQINETEGQKYRRIVNEKAWEIMPLLNGMSMCQIEDVLKEIAIFIKFKPITI